MSLSCYNKNNTNHHPCPYHDRHNDNHNYSNTNSDQYNLNYFITNNLQGNNDSYNISNNNSDYNYSYYRYNDHGCYWHSVSPVPEQLPRHSQLHRRGRKFVLCLPV
ncbi:hypothetical protein DPMN_051782 [Dreissena polymorpha]|uniref:Uncharacterized protein n=1 Tax=Dreissena polymorpha TaxID=45954 RepID=A0A9D4CIG4_DREPO|nr:hypothetical protein DPMN_051782 [Dreissena polymorpha]